MKKAVLALALAAGIAGEAGAQGSYVNGTSLLTIWRTGTFSQRAWLRERYQLLSGVGNSGPIGGAGLQFHCAHAVHRRRFRSALTFSKSSQCHHHIWSLVEPILTAKVGVIEPEACGSF